VAALSELPPMNPTRSQRPAIERLIEQANRPAFTATERVPPRCGERGRTPLSETVIDTCPYPCVRNALYASPRCAGSRCSRIPRHPCQGRRPVTRPERPGSSLPGPPQPATIPRPQADSGTPPGGLARRLQSQPLPDELSCIRFGGNTSRLKSLAVPEDVRS